MRVRDTRQAVSGSPDPGRRNPVSGNCRLASPAEQRKDQDQLALQHCRCQSQTQTVVPGTGVRSKHILKSGRLRSSERSLTCQNLCGGLVVLSFEVWIASHCLHSAIACPVAPADRDGRRLWGSDAATVYEVLAGDVFHVAEQRVNARVRDALERHLVEERWPVVVVLPVLRAVRVEDPTAVAVRDPVLP